MYGLTYYHLGSNYPTIKVQFKRITELIRQYPRVLSKIRKNFGNVHFCFFAFKENAHSARISHILEADIMPFLWPKGLHFH